MSLSERLVFSRRDSRETSFESHSFFKESMRSSNQRAEALYKHAVERVMRQYSTTAAAAAAPQQQSNTTTNTTTVVGRRRTIMVVGRGAPPPPSPVTTLPPPPSSSSSGWWRWWKKGTTKESVNSPPLPPLPQNNEEEKPCLERPGVDIKLTLGMHIPLWILGAATVLLVCMDYGVPIAQDSTANVTVPLDKLRHFMPWSEKLAALDAALVKDKSAFRICALQAGRLTKDAMDQATVCNLAMHNKTSIPQRVSCIPSMSNMPGWKGSDCQIMHDGMNKTVNNMRDGEINYMLDHMVGGVVNFVYTALAVYAIFELHGTWESGTIFHVLCMAMFLCSEYEWGLPLNGTVQTMRTTGSQMWSAIAFFLGFFFTSTKEVEDANPFMRGVQTCLASMVFSFSVKNSYHAIFQVLRDFISLFYPPAALQKSFTWSKSMGQLCVAALPLWLVLRYFWLADSVAAWAQRVNLNPGICLFVVRTLFFNILFLNPKVRNWVENLFVQNQGSSAMAALWVVQYIAVNYYAIFPIENMFLNLYEMSTMMPALVNSYQAKAV